MKVAFVDGYTDEPAALGVPPYLAPLPRYLVGAATEAGLEEMTLLTIDRVRQMGRGGEARPRGGRVRPRAGRADKGPLRFPGEADLLVLVGGAIVPGNYLHGRPASLRELIEMATTFNGPTLLTGPVARYGWTSGSRATAPAMERFDMVARLDGDAFLHDLLDTGEVPLDRYRTPGEWARWSVSGARVVEQLLPDRSPLIAEVETYRGCVRHAFGGCSFCTTVRDAPPSFRAPGEVGDEVGALASLGVVNFRLGGQSCIYSYMAKDVGKAETPTPDPGAVGALLRAVRSAAPGLEVLHVDNANPAVIAEHPEEAEDVTRCLVDLCTGGNVVALGLESADPRVKEANNLNASAEQCLEAIRSINRVGGVATGTGLPALLPGLNLLAGLHGESHETFDLNMAFLQRVLDEGLLLRRINIRQVASVCDEFDVKSHHGEFITFKDKVRREVDREMLSRLLPYGAPLRRVWLETHRGNVTFGRQVGSYPLLVGIPAKLELERFIDVSVVDHGFRSVTAVPLPLDINGCPMSLLAAIPGIGSRRAARIARARPLDGPDALRAILDDPGVADLLAPLVRW